MISKRLKSLVKFIDKSDRLIDVGCDHALLAIYLIKNNYLDTVLVSDVNPNALQMGTDNIAKYGFTDKIKVMLADGIDQIDASINTALISGMGTKTINQILSHSNIKYLNKLIIQSNNDYYDLRTEVTKMGFYIAKEEFVTERGRFYVNLVFLRGKKKYRKKELLYGPILINSGKEYYKYLIKKEEGILRKIPSRKIFVRLRYKMSIKALKKILRESN